MNLSERTIASFTRTVSLVIWILMGCILSSVSAADDATEPRRIDTLNSSPPSELYSLASAGSATAQYELGLLYEYGRGVDQSDSIAVFWYEKSADQHFADANYRLAIFYDNGWGLHPNKKKALELYQVAAEKGHSLAQHDLAIMYFQGSDAPKNLLQAYKWLKIAVMTGNPLMQKHLIVVAKHMSADEIEVAEYLAEEWVEYAGI